MPPRIIPAGVPPRHLVSAATGTATSGPPIDVTQIRACPAEPAAAGGAAFMAPVCPLATGSMPPGLMGAWSSERPAMPWLRCVFLDSLGAGEAAGHDGDHGPGDHGFVVAGEALVVAGATAGCGDPRQGALHHPAAGRAPGDISGSGGAGEGA